MIEDALVEAFIEDQNARMSDEFGDHSEMSKRHVALLRPWLENNGWACRGDDEMHLFTLVIHADYDIEFQKYALGLMMERSTRRDLVAYLTDRILVNSLRPQIFGTQLMYDSDRNMYIAYEIRDAGTVDLRRAGVGLPPLNEYIRSLY